MNDFEMVPFAPTMTGTNSVSTLHIRYMFTVRYYNLKISSPSITTTTPTPTTTTTTTTTTTRPTPITTTTTTIIITTPPPVYCYYSWF